MLDSDWVLPGISLSTFSPPQVRPLFLCRGVQGEGLLQVFRIQVGAGQASGKRGGMYSTLHCTALHCTALSSESEFLGENCHLSELAQGGEQGLQVIHCSNLLYFIVLLSTVLYYTIKHCSLLHCNTRRCIVFFCTIMYYTVLLG